MVFPGVTIPQGCLIGAKSLVHTKAAKELKPWTVSWGNPLNQYKVRSKERILERFNDPEWLKDHEF